MTIESLQNQTVKKLVKLHKAKGRQETGLFLVEGAHLIEEAWKAGWLERLYLLSNANVPSDCPVAFDLCSQDVLNKISAQKSDARCIGVCRIPKTAPDFACSKTLVLDGVQDPGNVGTLIRSAYSFGVEQVILGTGCADPFSPKVIQSTQGALFHIPCIQHNAYEAATAIQDNGIPVLGAALHQDSINLHDLKTPKSFCLVIGSEGKGISKEVLQACTETVFIEMNAFESLNAAIAGSIILYAFQFPA